MIGQDEQDNGGDTPMGGLSSDDQGQRKFLL